MNFLLVDVIQFVSGTMITFSQGGVAKIESKQFSDFGSRTKHAEGKLRCLTSRRSFATKTNFICCSSRKMNFGQTSEILSLHFCVNKELCIQPATIANCLKVIDFS